MVMLLDEPIQTEAVHSDAYYLAMEIQQEERLFKSIESSFKALEPFRNLNRGLIREYSGHNYGKLGANGLPKNKKYLNKMFQAINGHMMLLAANRPQVMVQTQYKALKGFARHYQANMNNLLKEIEFESALEDWVLNGLFCLGIMKVYQKETGKVVYELDIAADPGCPFASCVYLDNWVHDMSAKRYQEIQFAGDMYRIPFSKLKQGIESGFYDAVAAEDLQPTSKSLDLDSEAVQAISRGWKTDIDELEPMIDLADIWLPRERVLKTYAVASRRDFLLQGRPLATLEWDGLELGPYHLLGFSDVPENIMPTSPAAYWEAMDEFVNIAQRKVVRQTIRQKENLCGDASAGDSLRKAKQAYDGEVLPGMKKDSVWVFRQGGADPNLQVTTQNAVDKFDEMANNLKSILGLGPQAETLGQEQLISTAGNRLASQMQYKVIRATTKVVANLGCLLWQDQFKEIESIIETPLVGGEFKADASPWQPGDREGNFAQYNFDIVPISMSLQTPSQKAMSLTQLLTQIILPSQQMMMAQGVALDFAQLFKMYAEYLNLPELSEIVRVQGMPNMEAVQPSGNIVGKAPVTTRNYVRRSKGGNPSGNQLIHQQSFATNGAAQNGWSSGNGTGAVDL